jgi:hypothetical protein
MNVQLPPALLLGFLLSLGYASLFHLWGGHTIRDLFVYVVMACLGFAIGQLIGLFIQAPLLRVGPLHLLEATLGAWAALVVAREYQKASK